MARTKRIQENGREAGPFSGLAFAVYARKSDEDARQEDHKSTARQVEHARRYVEARGGELLAEHVYSDEVSGAEFKARPGLLRLLNAIENGRPFNALVMSEQSRLAREQVEGAYILKKLTDAGVRVFYYLEDREARLESALDKMMSSLSLFAAEMEREKARQRARDAAERKARQGYVTGGDCFGYLNVRMKGDRPVAPGEKHDYVVRRIQEDQAEAVRGIFRMYAAGWGMTAVAKAMNVVAAYAEQTREFFGGKPPAPPRHGTGSWSPACVREFLYRRLYRGELVWGRTTKADRDGRAGISVDRDPAGWLVVPAPDLRIVPEDLWQAVQARLKLVNEDYLRDTRGKLWGKPDRRSEGRYLLSGLAMCGCCRWNLTVVGGKYKTYGCPQHYRRGTCDNGLIQRVDRVDAAFLAALEREVLTPERFRYAVAGAVERVREQLAREPDRGSALTREKAALARKVERIVAAIGDGRGPAALVQEIARAEARLQEIEAEMARLAAVPTLTTLDLKHIGRQVEEELARFAEVLRGTVPRARQALKKILVDRVEFTPVPAGNGKRTYAFTAELTYGAILQGSPVVPGSATANAPWGHQPVRFRKSEANNFASWDRTTHVGMVSEASGSRRGRDPGGCTGVSLTLVGISGRFDRRVGGWDVR